MTKTPSTAKAGDGRLRLLAFVALGVGAAAISGRLAVHAVNDTPSYLQYPFDSLTAALLSIRTPGYPLFLAMVRGTVGLSLVPLLQVILHAVASWSLTEELLRRGMPWSGAWGAGLCVMLGCTAAGHIHTISTDAPAASLGVIAAVLLMRSIGTLQAKPAITCGIVTVVAILVRPAYLHLIPWVVCGAWLLGRRDWPMDTEKRRRSRWLGIKIAAAVTVPLVAWMGLRQVIVNDFGLLPFGHQNLSAVLVQLVPADVLRNLPTGDGNGAAELGRRVADELERRRFELPASPGDRIATLTLEQQWGQINYTVIWPIAKQIVRQSNPSDPDVSDRVGVHRMIGDMNRAILRASPGGYAGWLALATRRAAWGTAANIVMHPVFLAAALIGLSWLLKRSVDPHPPAAITVPQGWYALATVAISYAVFNIGFIVLTSPPIGRFADAGAIFFPSLAASFFLAGRTTGVPAPRSNDCTP